MSFPSALPNIVPMGQYVGEILSDPEKKVSKFDESKFYYELPMVLQNEAGEFFDFTFSFGLKSPVYHQLLQILGGQPLPSGITSPPPEDCVGKKVLIRITERPAKNDRNRLVNDVLAILPYKPRTARIVEPESIPEIEVPF